MNTKHTNRTRRYLLATGAALKAGALPYHANAAIITYDVNQVINNSVGSPTVSGADVRFDQHAFSHTFDTDQSTGTLSLNTEADSLTGIAGVYGAAGGFYPVRFTKESQTVTGDGGLVLYSKTAASDPIVLAKLEANGSSVGQFYSENEDQTGYLGLRLNGVGGNTHYGWLEVEVASATSATPLALTLKTVAYEDVADQPIMIGSGVSLAVPEVSNFALMAGGVASLLILLRRRVRK
jgi:hypothetical protein